MVFDNNLYYQDKAYRTPAIRPLFAHNLHRMSDKDCLYIDKKSGIS